MGGADQPVGRRTDRAGDQTRHPLLDDGGRRSVGHLGSRRGPTTRRTAPAPPGRPATRPRPAASRRAAVRDPGSPGRPATQSADGIDPAEPLEHLRGHGPMVRQARTARTRGPWRRRRSGRGRDGRYSIGPVCRPRPPNRLSDTSQLRSRSRRSGRCRGRVAGADVTASRERRRQWKKFDWACSVPATSRP